MVDGDIKKLLLANIVYSKSSKLNSINSELVLDLPENRDICVRAITNEFCLLLYFENNQCQLCLIFLLNLKS